MAEPRSLLSRIQGGTHGLGVALIVLGALAAIAPAIAGAPVVIVVGLLLALAGGVRAVFGWRAWNEGMRELLGIVPPNDALGCLQDIHWPDGAWGYFPTYTLGALAAAQLFAATRRAYWWQAGCCAKAPSGCALWRRCGCASGNPAASCSRSLHQLRDSAAGSGSAHAGTDTPRPRPERVTLVCCCTRQCSRRCPRRAQYIKHKRAT